MATKVKPDNSQRISDCSSRIAQCEANIRILQSEISDLQKRRGLLTDGRTEETQRRSQFVNSVDEEITRIGRAERIDNMKVAWGYSEDIRQVVRGSACKNAEDAHDQIITEIDKALKKTDEEINVKNSQINSNQSEINALRHEISRL